MSPPPRRFRDRTDAGRELAVLLRHHAGDPRTLVLGLPRGGVPVAREIAAALGAPLDVFVVRKLGVPGHEELAFGAIATGQTLVLNDDVVRGLRITSSVIDAVAEQEGRELERRERTFRGDRAPIDPKGRIVILVDDGLATGATMRAAVRALRERGADRLVVAVPVAAPQACAEFQTDVDEIVCAMTPDPFEAVGLWYEDFSQTSDAEVQAILGESGMGNRDSGASQ